MLFWIIGVLVCAGGLMVGVELLLARLGISPAKPADRSGGIRDVVQKVNVWSAAQRSDYIARRSENRDRR